jgi:hypothetical protein
MNVIEPRRTNRSRKNRNKRSIETTYDPPGPADITIIRSAAHGLQRVPAP